MIERSDSKFRSRTTSRLICGLGLTLTLWLGSGLLASAAKGHAAIEETDICTLSAHPERFKNKLVRFRARVWLGVEGACLMDKKSKCVVALQVPRAVENDPDVKNATREAMDALKDVTGTVTGHFFVKRRHGHLIPIIDAIKFTNVKIASVKVGPGH